MGHGHVTPNKNGVKARCGGPYICPECAREYAAVVAKLAPDYTPKPKPIEWGDA